MGQTRFIVAGSLIDGSGTNIRRNVYIAVKDGIIIDIDCKERLPRIGDTAIDDLSHCIVLPPLVDCSVSLSQSPSVDSRVRLSSEEAGPEKKAVMFSRHIRYCHAYGIQGMAISDDIRDIAEPSHGKMKEWSIVDIRTSNRLFRSSEDCVAGNSTGADFIKIAFSCNIEDEESRIPELNREDLYSLLHHRGDKKVVVVANGQQQVKKALDTGCDAIEQGFDMGEDNLREMAKKGTLWIPSVLRAKNALDGASTSGDVCCRFSQRYVAPGKPVPGAEDFWKKMLAQQLKQLQLARLLGVTTAVGTGAGSVGILHGESMAEEMKLFIKAGYSLEETFRCASENGASFFGMERLGTLTTGRQATFLIARGTAQQLPRKLSYLEGIYVDGSPSTAYHKNPVRAV